MKLGNHLKLRLAVVFATSGLVIPVLAWITRDLELSRAFFVLTGVLHGLLAEKIASWFEATPRTKAKKFAGDTHVPG